MKYPATIASLCFALLVTESALAARADRSGDAFFGGKPLAPIAISYEFGGELAVGRIVEISLQITPSADLRGGVLTLGAADPLALIEPAPEVAIGDLAAGESAAIAISVLPLIDNTHYLDVIVRGEVGGEEQVRAIAIAIRLPGGEVLKSAEPATSQRTGSDAVQPMPAVETVY